MKMLPKADATIHEQIKDWLKSHGDNRFKIYHLGQEEPEKVRLFISSNGELCRFKKRSSRRGYLLSNGLVMAEPVVSRARKTPEQKWIDSWTKVLDRIKTSGLWENLIPDIETSLQIGYDQLLQAEKDYWTISYKEDEREEDARAFMEKYPALAHVGDDGKVCINTSILFHIPKIPKVKKMRFAKKFENDRILSMIQDKMAKKEDYSIQRQLGYDVSFEYRADRNRAWYSEEYRGCANGHYYIALNGTHAIFHEDD